LTTGVLSKLGDEVSRQNAEMLSVLLANQGGAKIGHGDNLEQLTMFCRQGDPRVEGIGSTASQYEIQHLQLYFP
jgi:hypothetical protein